MNGRSDSQGTTTLVLCGERPNDALLVKGLWQVGRDESMQMVYRAVPWPHEQQFVAALDLYLQECATAPRDRAAKAAFDRFTTKNCHAFLTHREERFIMRAVRFRIELPDEHGLAAFLRRFVGRLIAAAALATLAFVLRDMLVTAALCAVAAVYVLYSAGAVAWRKIRRVRRYHASMRRGLGKLYSSTIDYQPTDLSDDRTPTLLKCAKEIEALGGHHVCDVTATSEKGIPRSQRHFAVGDATAAVGLLEETENHLYFPARPVILISTRFKDGHRHYTLNHPIHRKTSRPQITRSCLLNGGGIDEQMALHRRFVDKLIADGAIPMPPPKTPAALLNHLRQLHEEGREAWQRSPYSWGDAVHDAFKLCRRDARP